jgi:Protein of unknown function (DUF4236)
MGFRFYRGVRFLPGLSTNLPQTGPALNIYLRGTHVTFGPSGLARTATIPGAGIYYTSPAGYHTGLRYWQSEFKTVPVWQWLVFLAAVVFLVVVVAVTGAAVNSQATGSLRCPLITSGERPGVTIRAGGISIDKVSHCTSFHAPRESS